MSPKKLFAAATGLAFAAVATPASAGVATATMPVSAVVLENCTVTATPMAFGSMVNVGAANVDSTSTIALVCTPNADFDVALSDGANASGGQRRLKHSVNAEYINYDVFLDAARSQHWGNTTGTDTKPGTAPLGAATYTAYGRIPSGVTPVSAGAYSDSLTVTVTF
jgi:spore coat protein U-like protein